MPFLEFGVKALSPKKLAHYMCPFSPPQDMVRLPPELHSTQDCVRVPRGVNQVCSSDHGIAVVYLVEDA